MTPHILILAAGMSSRMRGADKLLEDVGGKPLLTHIVSEAVETGVPVTVALPPDRPGRLAALQSLPVDRAVVSDPAKGLSASLRAGLATIPDTSPVMLLLADLPEITAADLRLMLAEWQTTPNLILRGASKDGTAGHPVCFPIWARADLAELEGDSGARSLLERHRDRLRLVVLPDHHATTDLDTPEDWADWRRQNS
jgi:molybdenum cofactor cytidylyltransferase